MICKYLTIMFSEVLNYYSNCMCKSYWSHWFRSASRNNNFLSIIYFMFSGAYRSYWYCWSYWSYRSYWLYWSYWSYWSYWLLCSIDYVDYIDHIFRSYSSPSNNSNYLCSINILRSRITGRHFLSTLQEISEDEFIDSKQ